jgi:hypothetical protein
MRSTVGVTGVQQFQGWAVCEQEYNIPHELNRHLCLYGSIYNGKTIPITGRESLQVCETSRFSRYLDNRLTEGGEVVSLTRRPHFTPRKIPGTHFC